MTTTQHPACCKDPENCSLTYKEHLVGFGLGAAIIPNRSINHTPGVPDEPVAHTLVREKRWDRDLAAFERLHKEGVTPPRVDGAALRERQGQTAYDVTERPVTIDWTDPT